MPTIISINMKLLDTMCFSSEAKDCNVLSFYQIKIRHMFKMQFRAISSNIIPVIISVHVVVTTLSILHTTETIQCISKTGEGAPNTPPALNIL